MGLPKLKEARARKHIPYYTCTIARTGGPNWPNLGKDQTDSKTRKQMGQVLYLSFLLSSSFFATIATASSSSSLPLSSSSSSFLIFPLSQNYIFHHMKKTCFQYQGSPFPLFLIVIFFFTLNGYGLFHPPFLHHLALPPPPLGSFLNTFSSFFFFTSNSIQRGLNQPTPWAPLTCRSMAPTTTSLTLTSLVFQVPPCGFHKSHQLCTHVHKLYLTYGRYNSVQVGLTGSTNQVSQ